VALQRAAASRPCAWPHEPSRAAHLAAPAAAALPSAPAAAGPHAPPQSPALSEPLCGPSRRRPDIDPAPPCSPAQPSSRPSMPPPPKGRRGSQVRCSADPGGSWPCTHSSDGAGALLTLRQQLQPVAPRAAGSGRAAAPARPAGAAARTQAAAYWRAACVGFCSAWPAVSCLAGRSRSGGRHAPGAGQPRLNPTPPFPHCAGA
jgi:hypothetical protein